MSDTGSAAGAAGSESLEGRVALVTGAASPRGQGAAEARLLARAGAAVVLADIDDEEGAATAAAIGERASYVRLDVTDERQWEAVVGGIVAAHGRLDVLVNNAGVWHAGTLADTTPDEYRRVVEINQVGVFLGMRAAAAAMRPARRGSIVNVSSNAGLRVALPNLAGGKAQAYVASKWAVRGMTKAAALELAPFGIRVNSIHPGPTDTAMIDAGHEAIAAGLPLRRLATPDEIAGVVLFLASDASAYVSGAEIAIDGGASA
ncbi:MAG TPA: glucose 1-dehydrogenase [Gaiellaceae bacterium]|nr:glucose 1-dehydrogenase [Gaiellaceae bacterium]